MAFPGCFSGTVKSYGYDGKGMITTDDGLDIAVEAKACTDGKTLQAGDKVKFDLEDSPTSPGEMVAGNVSGGTAAPGGAKGGWGKDAGKGAWGGGGGWGKDAGKGGKGGKDGGKDGKAPQPCNQPQTGKKMKMCQHFPEGTCRRGENCTFAHTEAEIGTTYDLAGTGVRFKPTPTGTMQGWVKTFTPDKGFGFLTSSDGNDYFFHQKQFVDGTSPVQGDTLQHDLEPSPLKPGQFQGSNITGGTVPFKGLPKGKGDGKGKGKGKDKGKGKGKSKDGGKGKGKDDGKGGPRLTGKKHQMCTHFPLGTCRRGDMCTFAHTEAEVGTSYDHTGGAGGGGYGAAPKGGGKAAGPYGW